MSLHVVVKLACNIIKKNEDHTSEGKPWGGGGIILTGFEAVVAGATDVRAGWRSPDAIPRGQNQN